MDEVGSDADSPSGANGLVSPVFNRSQSLLQHSSGDEESFNEKREHILNLWEKLESGRLPEYNKAAKRLEDICRERQFAAEVFYHYEKSLIDIEYKQEKKAAEEEFQKNKQELLNMLTSELEEKQRQIIQERNNFDLSFTGSIKEVKTPQRRKLRRRLQMETPTTPNVLSAAVLPELQDLADSPIMKRQRISNSTVVNSSINMSATLLHQQPQLCILNHMLEDNEIAEDLHLLKSVTPSANQSSESGSNRHRTNSSRESDSSHEMRRLVRVVDNLLFYDNRCFSKGIPVLVDCREGNSMKFSGIVTLVTPQELFIKRSSDGGKVKIQIKHLRSGKFTLTRKS